MVLLKQYTDSNNRKKKAIILLGSVEEAIEAGQHSGNYYEVIDLVSGRVIDWNEVNIRPEEEWYYDDSEMIWKRWKSEPVREISTSSFLDITTGRSEEIVTHRFCF